ncbi:uncharacterized protein LOC132304751 [Cornus florida]|uniref:uncharacterized protein LOC132304751 n=1 Tax=Cornus florida TaxID=4283 RepID=UPI002898392D|nr:uncharacterized protein LOC132304751 [Cornus florida]
MTQMGLPWWPKNSTTTPTTNCGGPTGGAPTTTTSTSNPSCCCLSKLVKKLKKHSRMLRKTTRQSSFQCRYDPLSYSLNFDTRSGCGSLLDDEDYYRFYAFTSRFVANPRTATCPRLVASVH